MFLVHPLPAFQDNYIWVIQLPNSNEVAVVDPGDAKPVERYLKETGKQLSAILITHHHPDHTGGVHRLCRDRAIPVYGPANSPFGGISEPLRSNDRIELWGVTLQVKEVPAHTLDHIAYFQPKDQPQLFCGDTLFLAGCGRLFEGTAAQMHAAMSYFASLPEETEVYCTHEYSLANLAFARAVEPDNPAIDETLKWCQQRRDTGLPTLPSSIRQELSINPYMRVHLPCVRARAIEFSGRPLETEVEVLASIRRWKNEF